MSRCVCLPCRFISCTHDQQKRVHISCSQRTVDKRKRSDVSLYTTTTTTTANEPAPKSGWVVARIKTRWMPNRVVMFALCFRLHRNQRPSSHETKKCDQFSNYNIYMCVCVWVYGSMQCLRFCALKKIINNVERGTHRQIIVKFYKVISPLGTVTVWKTGRDQSTDQSISPRCRGCGRCGWLAEAIVGHDDERQATTAPN